MTHEHFTILCACDVQLLPPLADTEEALLPTAVTYSGRVSLYLKRERRPTPDQGPLADVACGLVRCRGRLRQPSSFALVRAPAAVAAGAVLGALDAAGRRRHAAQEVELAAEAEAAGAAAQPAHAAVHAACSAGWVSV